MNDKAKDVQGKQRIKLTFEFEDYSNPDMSQRNEFELIDAAESVQIVQAGAIMPALELMAIRFNKMHTARIVAKNPDYIDFLTSLSE